MEKDPVVHAIKVLADAQMTGDRALLNLIEALIEKVNLLEHRVFECECQLQMTGNPFPRVDKAL